MDKFYKIPLFIIGLPIYFLILLLAGISATLFIFADQILVWLKIKKVGYLPSEGCGFFGYWKPDFVGKLLYLVGGKWKLLP